MADHDVFILGAGFSKAISCLMPTTIELTHIIDKRLEQDRISLPPPVKDDQYSEKQIHNNIELWMTYLSQDQPWLDKKFNRDNKATNRKIQKRVVNVISERESQVVNSQPAQDWLYHLVEYWSQPISGVSETSVISLNYDTLVERAAVDKGITLEQIYPPGFIRIPTQGVTASGTSSESKFAFYKLHGSVNWFSFKRESPESICYFDVSPWGPEQQHERESCWSIGNRQPLIIPPVFDKTAYFKDQSVRGIWYKASAALWRATRVFLIGYSLPVSGSCNAFLLEATPARFVCVMVYHKYRC